MSVKMPQMYTCTLSSSWLHFKMKMFSAKKETSLLKRFIIYVSMGWWVGGASAGWLWWAGPGSIPVPQDRHQQQEKHWRQQSEMTSCSELMFHICTAEILTSPFSLLRLSTAALNDYHVLALHWSHRGKQPTVSENSRGSFNSSHFCSEGI